MLSVAGKALIVACLLLLASGIASAEQVGFSLAVDQAVAVGNYALQFRGVVGGHPYYDLYHLGSLVARLPSNPIPPNPSPYGYQNVFVETTAITTDGLMATGTIKIR